MEISKPWRLKTQRLRFANTIVVEGNDYHVLDGFGNNLWMMSKTGGENFMLPKREGESPVFSKRNDHPQTEKTPEPNLIYQASTETKV